MQGNESIRSQETPFPELNEVRVAATGLSSGISERDFPAGSISDFHLPHPHFIRVGRRKHYPLTYLVVEITFTFNPNDLLLDIRKWVSIVESSAGHFRRNLGVTLVYTSCAMRRLAWISATLTALI
ncbi:hypothetical protein SUGI_0350640 [Cryptomeria japonica]|nr:hypothetical protein SUGI_0350640 [Cryptomeria japonica]